MQNINTLRLLLKRQRVENKYIKQEGHDGPDIAHLCQQAFKVQRVNGFLAILVANNPRIIPVKFQLNRTTGFRGIGF